MDRTNAKTDLTALRAWCAAALIKAHGRRVSGPIRKLNDERAGRALAGLSADAEALDLVEAKLARSGIVFVKRWDHLPGTYLDGAAMLRADGVPIIALTLRHDRLDNFWFTLLHEFCHVRKHLLAGTSIIVDDLDVNSSDKIEDEADLFAQNCLIPPELWAATKSEALSPEDIISIAGTAGVNPAVVAGRWRRDFGDYRDFSKTLGHNEVRAKFA